MAKLTGKRTQVYEPNDSNAITVSGVSKSFRLPHNRQNSLKGTIVNLIGGGDRTFETQEVLKNVSFEIKKGEFFGIVGRNGSGKSTLLKMLAGIYKPTAGEIVVNGSLTPFIELGVGFNPELTGRENVYLNGALLGFNDREVTAMYDDIVAFAELERFMDQKLKNYSSGMQVRLAFSIAIRARSDILLLDEVLAVGDEAFQRKCYDYFEDLKRNKKTVIIVTHDMAAVEKFCSRAILIENGEIVKEGEPAVVAHAYSAMFTTEAEKQPTDKETEAEAEEVSRWGDGRMKIFRPTVKMADPNKVGSEISITMQVVCNTPVIDEVLAAYALKDSIGQKLIGAKVIVPKLSKIKNGEKIEITFTLPNILNAGRYFIDLSLCDMQQNAFMDCWIDCISFTTKTKGVQGYPIVVDGGFRYR